MVILLLSLAAALAQDPEEEEEDEEAEVITLSGGLSSTSGPSALDDFDQSTAETDELAPGLQLLAGSPRSLIRGRFSARPLLLAVGAQGEDTGEVGVGLGAAGLHRWWVLGERPVQLGGESRLEAVSNLGSGYQLSLFSVVGPWLGPVGLHAGPSLRFDRADWSTAEVTQEAGLLAGGRALGSAALGPVSLYAGADLAAGLTGGRSTEWTALGGGVLDRGFVQIIGRVSWREAPEGALWTAGIGLHLRPRL
ncbi:MAG: hypothetical protein ACI8S6_002158 [Myxococcota bacterium]|jgi:hypothetical protein